jgi:hypothetical protein
MLRLLRALPPAARPHGRPYMASSSPAPESKKSERGLVGLDVLTVAVHLTAAMLAGTHPDTPFEGECLVLRVSNTIPCNPTG